MFIEQLPHNKQCFSYDVTINKLLSWTKPMQNKSSISKEKIPTSWENQLRKAPWADLYWFQDEATGDAGCSISPYHSQLFQYDLNRKRCRNYMFTSFTWNPALWLKNNELFHNQAVGHTVGDSTSWNVWRSNSSVHKLIKMTAFQPNSNPHIVHVWKFPCQRMVHFFAAHRNTHNTILETATVHH
jgi:hypothetical protein